MCRPLENHGGDGSEFRLSFGTDNRYCKGEFRRIGYFNITTRYLKYSQRADVGKTVSRPKSRLHKRLFLGGGIRSELYQEYNGSDKYTITIL